MKRCPECRRDYYDETLLYCLDDGNVLLAGPGRVPITDPRPYAFEAEPTIADIIDRSDLATQMYWPSTLNTGNTNAIAVLPFANMSKDEDAEYLSDGVAEELLNVLSRIRGLRVAGRTSAFSFKGKQATFAEIGQRLNVSSILEGSVRMAGKRVRIAVQLVNVSDGYHRWSRTYDRMMDDIFAIQDDIANSVVEELRPRLTGKPANTDDSIKVAAEVAIAAKGRAVSPEAHRLVLLGRHIAERRSSEAMAMAMEHFQQALDIDPLNAQCWLEIGLVNNARAAYGLVGYETGFEAARTAAEAALALEPNNAAGRALLARVKLNHDRDFEGADRDIKLAMTLEPENAYVLQAAGYVACCLGRIDQSLEIYRKLTTIDPLNALALQTLSYSAYLAGSVDEAETAIRRSLEIAPDGVYRHALLALILLEQGNTTEARAEAAKETGEIWRHWATALVAIKGGNISEAREALDLMIEKEPEESAFQISEIYTAIGEVDTAFMYLDVAVKSDPGITQILISRQLRPLYSDDRLPDILRKIGIPEQYWPERSASLTT